MASPPTSPTAGNDDTLELLRCRREAAWRSTTTLLTDNPIWRERTVGVGVITTEEALALGATGPILRSTGFAWDLRKAQPYLAYDDVDFDVIYTENGDVFDRYQIRLYEILESVKIVRQCVERMPGGDYRVQDRKVTPPPRARIDESMEALIHHFKLFTEGFRVPPGRDLRRGRVAARRDRLLSRVRRHRQAGAAAHPRAVLLQPAVDGRDGAGRHVRRRGRDRLEHRSDHGGGRPLVAFTPANLEHARGDRSARYPHTEVGALPLLHLAQDQDGWVTPEAMEEIAELLDLTPALVLGTCSFYTMFKRAPVGRLIVSVCTNVSCLVNGGPELLEHLQRRYADDDDVTVEEVECIAACDLAPVLQVNYEFHGPLTDESAAEIIEEYKRGRRVARTISGSPVRGTGLSANAGAG